MQKLTRCVIIDEGCITEFGVFSACVDGVQCIKKSYDAFFTKITKQGFASFFKTELNLFLRVWNII